MASDNKRHSIIRDKLTNIPTNPGIYKFLDNKGKILYIGKAINLRNRVRQYFSKSGTISSRIQAMIKKAHDVEYIVTDSEVEALILEATLIKRFKPYYNIDLKDDKSYPYIGVTDEPYPRVIVTRKLLKDGTKYFGPYTDVKNMRAALKMVRDIFKIRSCNYLITQETILKRKIKICLDYHIKKCDGPCEGLISQEKYNEMVNEVIQVLKGKLSSLINELQKKMNQASGQLNYEEAAELRDKIRNLNVYKERQKVIDIEAADRDVFAIAMGNNDACGVVFNIREGKIINTNHVYINSVKDTKEIEVLEQFLERYYLSNYDVPSEIYLPFNIPNSELIRNWLLIKSGVKPEIIIPKVGEKAKLLQMCRTNAVVLLDELKMRKHREYTPKSLISLQKDLRLSNLPRRIECFDISNIQGTDSVASMVVFINGRPKKSEYRRYKIQTVHGPDDYASIKEVIQRRYMEKEAESQDKPDLIVIDGGKGQLSAAINVINNLECSAQEHKGRKISNNHKETIIALAKKLDEVFIPERSEPICIPKDSPGLRLLQRIRDEAHRFAIEYHRKLRTKRTIKTELENIPGIGKKRALKILNIFGSVENVKNANEEQAKKALGESLAIKIKKYFKK